MNNPLDQFKVINLVPLKVADVDVSFTNSALVMVITVLCIATYILLAIRRQAVIPGYWQASVEIIYTQIESMLGGIIGSNHSKYTPFIFSVFMFVLMCNLLGMIPYGFSATSHVTVTFTLAIIVFITINIIGFWNHGLKYFSVLLPSGIPFFMVPLMLVVELCAFLARPISLSLRLAANMIAGHIMMKIVAAFIVMSGAASVLLGAAPLALLTIITGFEIFIAMLQAYIFTILSCIYLNDAVNLH